MGLGGISPWSLILILVIVLLLFGTKKLRNLGGDLGGALKGFKNAMSDEQANEEDKKLSTEEDEKKDSADSK
ncbi:MAG: twin-arginine translocase TatA/TatE family subunit [Agarilytica sp.]